MSLLGLTLVLTLAHAGELPSYRDEIVVATWTSADEALTRACRWPRGSEGVGVPIACDAEAVQRVIDKLEAFQTQVGEDARLRYLQGLAWRRLDQRVRAQRAYEAATALDPTRLDAWFDLGELHVIAEEWSAADTAFAHVTDQLAEGPRAWPGWMQRAQVAAHRGDAEAFEDHLLQALRYGFTFSTVASDPTWQGWAADPTLGPVIQRLLHSYADRDTQRAFPEPPEAP